MHDMLYELEKWLESYGFTDIEGLERLRQEKFKMPAATFYGNILEGIAVGFFQVKMGDDLVDQYDEVFEGEVYLLA